MDTEALAPTSIFHYCLALTAKHQDSSAPVPSEH